MMRFCPDPIYRAGKPLLLTTDSRQHLSGGRTHSALMFTSGRQDETTLHKRFWSHQKYLWDQNRREDDLLSIMEGSGNTTFTACLPTWNVACMFILLVLSDQLLMQFFSNSSFKTLTQLFCFPEMFKKRHNQTMTGNRWFLDSWPQMHRRTLGSLAYP